MKWPDSGETSKPGAKSYTNVVRTGASGKTGSNRPLNEPAQHATDALLGDWELGDETMVNGDSASDRTRNEGTAVTEALVPEPSWTEQDEISAIVENREFVPGPYLRGSVLGRGGLGDVYKVMRRADGKVFAGKTSKSLSQLYQEAQSLRSLQQGHILKYIDWYDTDANADATLLVTELCTGGMLQTMINNASHGMSAINILRVVEQVGGALAYIHSRGFFHTDVKPHNILIRTTNLLEVVLADCADVREVDQPTKLRGTKKYWSPEMVRKRAHCGPADDVWALGLTMMGMMAQWPQMLYTKRGLEKYPSECAAHAQTLVRLNEGHEVVKLLGEMLDSKAEERVKAGECAETAARLREKMQGGDERWSREGGLEIKTPEAFKPVSFW